MESSSSKRARAASGGNQVVCCLVDGCKSDLSKCRDYHRRHKVCELHSKTPKVTIGGREQRFCQQCSRFHSLGEFDEGKRSCRKRLEGHNRRRRKPQPESLPVKPGSFLSGAGAGSRFMPFSRSPMIPASSVVSSTWGGGGVKMESSQTHIGGSSSSSYSDPYRGRQFPFLQGSPSSSNDFSSRALSLLSSSPAETPEIGLTRMGVPGNPAHQGRPLDYSTCPQLQGAQIMPNLHHCQDVFQAASDGSCSATGPQQTLSFLWE